MAPKVYNLAIMCLRGKRSSLKGWCLITTLTTLTLLPLPHLQSTAIFFHNLWSGCMEVGGGRGRWSGHRVEGLLKDSYYVLRNQIYNVEENSNNSLDLVSWFQEVKLASPWPLGSCLKKLLCGHKRPRTRMLNDRSGITFLSFAMFFYAWAGCGLKRKDPA